MLHADIAPPGADRLVERVVGAGSAELLAVARAEALDRRVVEQHLADRAQRRLDRACRSSAGSADRSCGCFPACRQRNRAAAARPRPPDRGRRCRRAPRIRRARAPCRCGYSRCCERSSAAGRAPIRPPGRRVSTRPSNRLRGGTRWTSALTVVSTTSGVSPPPVASRVRVSMRRLTISPFGDTRS